MDTPYIVISNNFNEEEALTFKNDILNETPNPNSFYVVKPVGQSMEQYGLGDGREDKIYYNQKCVTGDNCDFQCLSEKCFCPNCVDVGGSKNTYIKHLVSVENDCYWFEGNPESRIEGNVKYTSFDSRQYGCLSSSEFRMLGVVK